jgi:hypothetical protein
MADQVIAPKAEADHACFSDQRRFHSPAVTRAFSSVMRAISEGAQLEVLEPDEVTLEHDAPSPVVRGVD